jgi:hypothetical protein
MAEIIPLRINPNIIKIMDEIREMAKPYRVCVCDDFVVADVLEDRLLYVCGSCGGYRSCQRVEKGN